MANWRSSTAYQIAFAYSAAVALGVILLGAAIFWAMHAAFTRQLDGIIMGEAQGLVAEYRMEGRNAFLQAIREREASKSSTNLYYALFRSDGHRIAGNLQTSWPPLGRHDIKFLDVAEGPNDVDEARSFAVDLGSGERLVVAADREWIEQGDETVLTVFGVGLAAAVVIGGIGAVAFGSYLRSRLRSISAGAEAIIAGDLRERMPVGTRGDEFDQVAMTLNRMLDRIEGLLENLRQVSSDIAHDLRTPLTRLRNALERGLSDREQSATVIEDALTRVDDVLSLFAAILRVAEVESGETRRFFAPVDLSALALELAESYAPAIQDGGRAFTSSIKPNLHVLGDAELISQAAINLIENAQRHTPTGTSIRFSAGSTGKFATLEVKDDGPGVPNAELGRITKRFTRLEASRNTSGHGLGLSLADAVAKIHGGKLVLKGVAPGLSATIKLPLAVNPSKQSQE